jgi:PAS domain S-box-containing protein
MAWKKGYRKVFMVDKFVQIFNKLKLISLQANNLGKSIYAKFLQYYPIIIKKAKNIIFFTTRHELQLLNRTILQKKPLPEVTTPELQIITTHLGHLRQSLEYSQACFHQIFNLTCLPMLLLTAGYQKIAAANQAFLDLTQYSPDQILGRNLQQINIGIFSAQYQQLVQLYQTNQSIRDFEITIENRNHLKLICLLNADAINLNDNQYVLVSLNDITSHKENLAKLQESHEYYTEILQGVGDIFFTLDKNACFTFANTYDSFFLNRKPEELIGHKIWRVFPSLANSTFQRKYLRTVTENAAAHFQAPSILGDQWYDFSIYPLKNGVSVFGRNITSQKKIVEALQQSNQQIGDMMDSIPEIFLFLDNNWRFIYVNKQAEKYFAGASEDLLGKRIWTVAPKMVGTAVAEQFHKAMSEQVPIYSDVPSPLSEQYFESHIYPSINGLSVYMHDITERKKIEEVQAKVEERYSNILNNIGDPIFVLDHEWRLVYINKEMEHFLEITPGQVLLGKFFWDVHPGFTTSALYQQLCKVKHDKQASRFEEYYPTRQAWIDINIFYYASGLVVCLRDITIRKKLEESSATERELLLITLRSIGDGVIAANRDGQVILINKTAEELTGWTYEEAVGAPLQKVFYVINDKTSEPYDDIVSLTIQSGETIQLNDAVLINRDFKELTIANSCAPICSSSGEFQGVVMVFQDITAKIKTEAELLKAHKIESIGVLAGGIAHDFNNFLAAILANIQLAALRLEKGYDIKKSLNEAIDATKKASELTKQLLTFSKGGAPVKKLVSITKLLEEWTNFHLSGSKIKPAFNIPTDLWHVEIDTGQFSQVVCNLVINAEQAMPNGGFLTVCAENVVISEDAPCKPGKYVKISFQDYGVGISEENLAKIFDPFFTTKKAGTGLGLATSYSIIKQHGGYIDLTSKVGTGTTFYLYLPASENVALQEQPLESLPLTGEGKVLVMDDEAMIRNVVSEMLTLLGYQVTAVPDGKAAIQLYQAALHSNQPFVAVITDLTVPGGMGGLETLGCLKEIDPQVKAIASSGYANDPIMADYAKYGFCGVIGKPYKIEEFSATLNKVLQLPEDRKLEAKG